MKRLIVFFLFIYAMLGILSVIVFVICALNLDKWLLAIIAGGLLGGIIGWLILLLIIHLDHAFSKHNRFVPTVKVSARKIHGKDENVNMDYKRITETEFYVVFEIAIAANGFLWKVFNNKIPFKIYHSKNILVAKKQKFTVQLHDANCVSGIEIEEKSLNEYTYNEFYAVASKRPKKAEIIYYCKHDPPLSNKTPFQFYVLFEKRIHKAYSTMITLGFAKP
ncbi:hypothetical protein [Leadbettera azotonutricia]|uniref:Uncharacterized protein n=1 Tax=Leadbettera azotonutricia (strain ATCC BAA-888 / DSM 13862 / ZAS-9) TaxID=545695 RepID=F5Y9A5_LEAAZ|nr:hypothetical protein [Leadbettera azotonutricia]AEF80155.1 hypothetical protein TREAZ_2156 [Leadbettera azotonutricia ZAS-9]